MPVDAGPEPEIFRLAVEASPSGMVVVDGAGAIVMINGEVERLFGYRREELLGRPVEVLLPDKFRDKHAGQRNGFMHCPGARRLGTGRDFQGRRKDGSEFPIEVGLNPQRIGSDVMVFCAIVDTSERKRLERLQDEFVTTVSHELRTPMTAISASLGLMIGGAAGSLSPSAAHLIEIAYANCRRLVRLVNDILDIKKLEAGQLELNFQRCGARALVEQAIEANHEFAEGYGVHIRVEAAAEAFDVRSTPIVSSRSSPICSPMPSSSRRRAKKSSSRSRPAATRFILRCATTVPAFRRSSSRGCSRNSPRPITGTASTRAAPGSV